MIEMTEQVITSTGSYRVLYGKPHHNMVLNKLDWLYKDREVIQQLMYFLYLKMASNKWAATIDHKRELQTMTNDVAG